MDRIYVYRSISSGRALRDAVDNVRGHLKHTRIAVIGNGLALEIVRELTSQERDLKIVRKPGVAVPAPEAVARGADVVVIGFDGPVRTKVANLLAERGHLRVLAISADGGESFLYELRPHERLLGEISKKTLLAAVKGRLPDDAGSTLGDA
jgi:hypothetical protein